MFDHLETKHCGGSNSAFGVEYWKFVTESRPAWRGKSVTKTEPKSEVPKISTVLTFIFVEYGQNR